MPVYRAETKFSTKKAGYSALSCVTAIYFLAINPLTVRDWNVGDEVVYPNVEDNAALLLLFPVKDHPFNDGCKRIGVFSEEWNALNKVR